MLAELCRRHTTLRDQDILKLEEVAGILKSMADLMEADLFVDCSTRDPDVAIVVAQARPANATSLYSGSVVGCFAYRSNEPGVIRTLEIGMPTRDMRAITQENKNVLQRVAPINNLEGEIIGALIAEKDITESVRTQQKLSVLTRTTAQLAEELSSNRVRDISLPYHVSDGVLMFNQAGICTYVNPAGENIYKKLGYLDRIEGLEFINLTLDGVCFQELLAGQHIVHYEVQVGRFFLNIKYALVNNSDPDASLVVMLLSDITEIKAKDKELSLKKVAISEVHHRVKNNLQTIASLLQLHSRRMDNEAARAAFEESIGRVLSIVVTHEMLAEDGTDDVDILSMLQKLGLGIMGQGQTAGKSIPIIIRGDTFKCNSDKASSVALVVNEAVQNCLKYAFQERRNGQIAVEICNGAAFANISIIDDGVGFDAEKARTGSLGFTIIQRIVSEKLGGKLTVESTPAGTKVLFDFPHNS